MARRPVWSGALTDSLAARVPPRHRRQALSAVKAIHTAIFVSIAAALVVALCDGVTARPGRRTTIAGGVVLAEVGVYLSNNKVCPQTPLAEDLGADRGSVVDLFLPAWVAKRIPVVAGSAALLALVLNARAVRNGRSGLRQPGGYRLL